MTLAGTGIAPQITLAPTTLDFGSQPVGVTSSAKSVTVSNTGSVSLAISQISTSTWQFAEQSTCPFSPSTLPAGTSCNISVTFAPSSRGSVSASLQISDNAPQNPQSVTLSGQGIQPAVSLSTSTLSFGNQNVGTTSQSQSVTVNNSGQDPLLISGISISGTNFNDFKESSNCVGTLAPNTKCSVSVIFAPTAASYRTALLTISDNAAGSPQTVNLSGTGTGPALTLSSSSLTFGNENVGATSTSQVVAVQNTGQTALNISSVAITGSNASEFSLASSANSCSTASQLNPGSSCNISVSFAPKAIGSRSGTLTVTDNAPGSPHLVNLTGTGQDFSLSVAPGSLGTATVTRGGTATYTVNVSPAGGFNQTVLLTCSGTPAHASCGLSPTSAFLNGTNPTAVTITVTTVSGSALVNKPSFPDRPQTLARVIPVLALLGVPPLWILSKRKKRILGSFLSALSVLLTVFLISSCIRILNGNGNGGGSSTGTPAGTYTLSVAGQSGSLNHSISLTLIVN